MSPQQKEVVVRVSHKALLLRGAGEAVCLLSIRPACLGGAGLCGAPVLTITALQASAAIVPTLPFNQTLGGAQALPAVADHHQHFYSVVNFLVVFNFLPSTLLVLHQAAQLAYVGY